MNTDNFWNTELVKEAVEFVGLRVCAKEDIRQSVSLLIEDFIKEKSKAPDTITLGSDKLFTTEDGKEIYDSKYLVHLVNNWYKYLGAISASQAQSSSDSHDLKYFSSEERANSYIIFNKPCLSITDIELAWDKDGRIDSIDLLRLVKEKIK